MKKFFAYTYGVAILGGLAFGVLSWVAGPVGKLMLSLLVVGRLLIYVAIFAATGGGLLLVRPRTSHSLLPLFVIAAVLVYAIVRGPPSMKRFLAIVAAVLSVPVALVLFLGIWDASAVWLNTESLHYRLTIMAKADGVLRTGSGVWGISCTDQPDLDGPSISCKISGEAIPIDLGARGVLFVTLHRRLVGSSARRRIDTNPIYLVGLARAFPDAGKDAQGRQQAISLLRALNRDKPKADLPLMYLTMLVRFRKITDPKSVEEVDPDDLAASFGPDVMLTKAMIEITDDPITRGIKKSLPWIDAAGLRYSSLDGDMSIARSSNLLSNRLSVADFKWGIK